MSSANRRTTRRSGRDSEGQAAARVRADLAACYRLVAHFRMTDLIYTHISARVPGRDARFLINPYGLLFEEITASSLVTVTLDGTIVDDPSGLGINPAGFVIHSAIHRARHDVGCVIHTHTAAGLAVAAQKKGLRPLTQHAMRFTGCLAYHDYEGVALDLPEQRRLVRDLGPRNAMILRNHGLLTCGARRRGRVRPHVLPRACVPGAGRGDDGRRRARRSGTGRRAQGRAAVRAAGAHGARQRLGRALAFARPSRSVVPVLIVAPGAGRFSYT